jgi:hypothetical protein
MSADAVANAIVAALSAGAVGGATEAGKKAVADAYDSLKSLILKRFGSGSEAAVAIEKLEAKPESEGRRATLGEELQSVDAASDPELVSAAQALLALVRALPQSESNVQIAQGTGIAQASHQSTATVTFSTEPKKNG